MHLVLHTEHDRESAIAAFGSPRSATKYLDGDFVVLETTVVCLFTAGFAGNARLETPTSIIWSPRHDIQTGGSGLNWWPAAVVEVFDRSGPSVVRKRQHQLFLRPEPIGAYLYVGPADLGSYGADREARFELTTRLPRPSWAALGGYSGWMLELEHDTHNIAEGDDRALDAELVRFAARPWSHLVLTRYEQDALHIYKNERCAWLMYLREPDDSGMYLDRASFHSESEEEHFRCDCGIDLQFPSHQTLPLPEALGIARFFFQNGKLPSDRDWTDDLAP